MEIIYNNDFKKVLTGMSGDETYFVELVNMGRGIWKATNIKVYEDINKGPILEGKYIYEINSYNKDPIKLLRLITKSKNEVKNEELSRVISYNELGDVVEDKIAVLNMDKFYARYGMGMNVYFYDDRDGLFKSNDKEVISNLEESNMYVDIIRDLAYKSEEFLEQDKVIRR